MFLMVVGWNKHSRSPGIVLVEVLVLGAIGWDKKIGALGRLSY